MAHTHGKVTTLRYVSVDVSHSLNSLEGAYMGASITGVIKGDARSLG